MSHPMTPTEMRDTPTEEAMREAVARIIDPTAWEEYLLEDGRVDTEVSAIFQDAYEDSLAKADQILALLSVQPSRPQGDWQPIETAPKDGTHILAFCVHANFDVAPPEDRARWTEIVITCWIDFNGGGWTWNGICGVHTHWMPLPEPPALSRNPQQGEG